MLSRNCNFCKFGPGFFLKLEIFNPILKFADLTASFSHFGVLAKAMQCTPAQTVPVWLWCPTSSASVRLSLCHSPPIGTKSIAWMLCRFNCSWCLGLQPGAARRLQPHKLPLQLSQLTGSVSVPAGSDPAGRIGRAIKRSARERSLVNLSSSYFWTASAFLWAVSYFKTQSLQSLATVLLMDYNLPGQAEGLQLNQPTTRPCS